MGFRIRRVLDVVRGHYAISDSNAWSYVLYPFVVAEAFLFDGNDLPGKSQNNGAQGRHSHEQQGVGLG